MIPFNLEPCEAAATTLPSSFLVKEELGSGDKGVVYQVRDAAGCPYAIKIYRTANELLENGFPSELVPYYFDEKGQSRMALREYELSQILTHPAFVKVYSATVVHDNSILVMEYIDGRIVSEVDITRRAPLFLTVVDALLFATQRGYIHADLYSGNAMITSQGAFKFIDLDSFDKVDSELEERSVKEFIDSYHFFLREFLTEVDETTQDYVKTHANRLSDDLTPDNLYLIENYLLNLKTRYTPTEVINE